MPSSFKDYDNVVGLNGYGDSDGGHTCQVPCSFKEYKVVGSPQSGASPALMFKYNDDHYDEDDEDRR